MNKIKTFEMIHLLCSCYFAPISCFDVTTAEILALVLLCWACPITLDCVVEDYSDYFDGE